MYFPLKFSTVPFLSSIVQSRLLATCVISRSRFLHNDGRNRVSNFWIPTGGMTKEDGKDSQSLLVRAGFIRRAHSGLFHFLPLGLRVLEKLERLIEKHMTSLGASKASLSTLSSEELWRKSGRLQGDNSELFRLQDRKGARYFLSPTHEEEITSLVGGIVNSYKELPLRIFQITRKYRDERRPRQGLLRSREFLMKDLYTFDSTKRAALETYENVRQRYSAFFDELKIPYMISEANSGSIGGDLSHEFHFPTLNGEDTIFNCDSCSYIANAEVARCGKQLGREAEEEAISALPKNNDGALEAHSDVQNLYKICFFNSIDERVLYRIVLPKEFITKTGGGRRATFANCHVLESTFPHINSSQVLGYSDRMTKTPPRGFGAKGFWTVTAFDCRIPPQIVDDLKDTDDPIIQDFVQPEQGLNCPNCEQGILQSQRAVELGHTFYLGTRYSKPLGATVDLQALHISEDDNSTLDSSTAAKDMELRQKPSTAAIEMGCYGIGLSRMIAAVADILADARGLNWPRVIAPFEAIVIPAKGLEDDAIDVLDLLTGNRPRSEDSLNRVSTQSGNIDAMLDDRAKDMAWKLKDADMIGYPVIVILGRSWKNEGKCEVQCRRPNLLRREVPLAELKGFVKYLLEKI